MMFKIEPFINWPAWAQDGFDRIGDCEDQADNSHFFDNADEWVDEALVQVVKTTFPTLLRRRQPVTGCYALGAMIGHQEWLIDNLDDLFPPEEVLDLMIEKLDRWFNAYLQTLTDAQRQQVMRQVRKNEAALNRLCRAFERACTLKKNAFSEVHVQSIRKAASHERLEFLEGYTNAHRKPAIPTPENMSPRERMLILISLGWRDVQKMKNRTVLRQTLGNIFDKPDVYNHEFVQGVCKDIGLDLKKGPGREKIG